MSHILLNIKHLIEINVTQSFTLSSLCYHFITTRLRLDYDSIETQTITQDFSKIENKLMRAQTFIIYKKNFDLIMSLKLISKV